MDEIRNIALPENLCRAAEKKFSYRFGSLEEFLTTMLGELLSEDALRMDERERQILEERLKALGYV